MALIVVSEHAYKRFKQRKGLDIKNKDQKENAKSLIAVAAMKDSLLRSRPHTVDILGDKYHLSYLESVEGEVVVNIHTVYSSSTAVPFKVKLKRKLRKWLNDW